jgi:hypothetical protein
VRARLPFVGACTAATVVGALAAVAVTRGASAAEDDAIVLVRGRTGDVAATRTVDDGGALAEAVALFQRERAAAILQSDASERFEELARPEQLLLAQADGRWLDLFLDGDDAFSFVFDRSFGAGRGAPPALGPHAPRPVHDADGGLDGSSCRSCHFVGGPDGAGTTPGRARLRGDGHTTTSGVLRDAPHVMGLGPVARLATEMTDDLQAVLATAEATASTTNVDVSFALVAKGVSFGTLVARPGGVVDRRGVDGVSADLIVRPFGLKGRHADLVALVDEALQVHHGVQTASALVRAGIANVNDPDGDGVVAPLLWRDGTDGAEASAAQAVLLAGYLAMLGVPEVHPPAAPDLLVRWSHGRALLDDVGCTLCHVESLPMANDVVTLSAADDGVGDALALALPLSSAQRAPQALRTDYAPGSSPPGTTPVFLFSDLKRHEMGTALADGVDEALPDGGGDVAAGQWLTRPLWGVAETAPYLHDGRAATLHEAIALHGGEAAGSRDAYLLLDDDDRASLRLFLLSLSRQRTVIVE